MGRTRASFGALIGAAALAGGVSVRFAVESISSELAWGALAVSLAAVLSSWLSKPRYELMIDLGLLPLAALVGVAMSVFALMEPSVRGALAPAGLECSGGAALILSVIRFVREQATRGLPKADLSTKRKVRLRREGVKKLPEVPVGSLVRGDIIELAAGQDTPVDGTVVEGTGFVDETSVFGPGLPVPKKPGDPIFAGTHTSIPDLALKVLAPADEAYLRRRDRLTAKVAEDLMPAGRGGRVAAGIVVALGIAGVVVLLLTREMSRIETWLPAVPVILLAAVAAAPALAAMRGRFSLLQLALAHGVVCTRAKDVTALSTVRRWQVDPSLLAAPGEAEAVALADASPDGLLQVAEVLLQAEPGPELATVRTALEGKKLPRLDGAALKKGGGIYRGTVGGKRWYLGPQQVIEEVEEVEIDNTMAGPIDFLRDKDLITLIIGNTQDGVLGAVGVGIHADLDAKTAATQVSATVMPGLPDVTRQAVARAAALECDGPPLDKRDATLLAVDSDPPSTGLRLRVMPVSPRAALPEGGSPRLFRSSLAYVGVLAGSARKIRARAQVDAAFLTVVPALLATGLAYAGVTGGLAGTGIGLAAIVLATRAPKPSESKAV